MSSSEERIWELVAEIERRELQMVLREVQGLPVTPEFERTLPAGGERRRTPR
jgi:hypothetical protein